MPAVPVETKLATDKPFGMLDDQDLARLAEKDWPTGRWFERDAALAVRRGDFFLIHGRKDPWLYLARFWLTPPKRRPDGELDSSESVLLQYFLRGDDDEALHDHPWSFSTRILAGGYHENLPPSDWSRDLGGPAWDLVSCWRPTGYRGYHQAADLHCVSKIETGTWTLVITGPVERKWGFFPPGKPWQYYREYLGLPAEASPLRTHTTPLAGG